nr:reverse transcriptase domain-containing protein [Tanacetum cinerariifolium]
MSTNEQTPLSQPTSTVRNTLGKKQAPQNLDRLISNEDLREYYDKNYHQILPIIAEKLHQEKAQQEKLKSVKACLNFEEASRYFESEMPSRRRNFKEMLGHRYFRTRSGSQEPRRGYSKSSEEKDPKRRTLFKRLEEGVFHMLGDKEKNVSAHSRGSEWKSYYSSRRDTERCYQISRSKEIEIASEKHRHKREYSQRMEAVSESEGSVGGHWKSKLKKQNSSIKDDLSQAWLCKETDPFIPRICYFDFLKARMPSHIKTYDESEDPKDHLKIFQSAAKTKRWAMPTWCHMFNSTLTENARVWFNDLSKESIDSYDSLRKTFLENYLQQKKCIKDLVEFTTSNKEIGNPQKSLCEGEVVASNRQRKNSFPSWKQKAGLKQNFKRGNFQNKQRTKRKQDKFTLLTKMPKEILALDKGKFKPPPLITISVEKRNASKLCEFHGEVGHTTDECMHLKRQIEEMLKAKKLSHLIKGLKQNHRKDQPKTAKKGETLGKDKPLAILMVQPWQRIARQRITQTFYLESIISFPTLGEKDKTEGPMIIEAEMEGH